MRRQLTTLALAALFGGLMLSSDASACCFKKKCKQPCAPPPCAPAVCVAPCPPPAPCVQTCAPRKKLFGGLCHKKQACAPVGYCATPVYQPAYASVQSVYPTGQH